MKNNSLKSKLAFISLKENLVKIYSDQKNECYHDILILLGYKMIGNVSAPVYRCLFCDHPFTDFLNLNNYTIINATNYNKESFNINNDRIVEYKFNMVRNIIIKMIQDNPNITNQELEVMANQSLNGYSYTKKYAI